MKKGSRESVGEEGRVTGRGEGRELRKVRMEEGKKGIKEVIKEAIQENRGEEREEGRGE